MKGKISQFLLEHFLHFNSATLVDAAKEYERQINVGNRMMVTLAGAMSTAELGKSLAEMIRQDKVHIITCTGANLEEDVFNLVAHNHYKRIPRYRDLTPFDEQELLKNHYNRVTDTCIPESEAMRVIESYLFDVWKEAESKDQSYLPHEYFFKILLRTDLQNKYQINPKDSWLIAAAEKNIPVIVPGWEDSTCGNFFASYCIQQELNPKTVKSGIHYMMFLADWYQQTIRECGVGFFQIGGGIAGDFPICVVPMLHQDLQVDNITMWTYFCQISDSTTSYGSYSGATPNEKISWGKLNPETPSFVIESDATIVAPLIFAYVLNW